MTARRLLVARSWMMASAFVLLGAAICAPGRAAGREMPDRAYGPYAAAVPTPTAILGYEPGSRVTNYRDLERVVSTIVAARPDRLSTVQYGASSEGRPLRIVVATCTRNARRLPEIRTALDRLADPRKASGAAVQADLPIVAWVNECVHGDEPASVEAGMWLIYTLAASDNPAVLNLLDRSVVIVNPLFNPDGHERYAVWYDSVQVGASDPAAYEASEPWEVSGRLNHYRFDMNRDLIAQTQAEVREECAEVRRWHPQVYVDEHGEVDSYFFPPNSRSVNSNVGRDRLEHWATVFGSASAAAFDSHGWRYVNRETFDFFFPGYLDIWATLNGAIGMTYETDGARSVQSRDSRNLPSSLALSAEKHFVAAMSTLQTAGEHRSELLEAYARFHAEAMSVSGGGLRSVYVSPGRDAGLATELCANLGNLGIEYRVATTAFTVRAAHPYIKPGAPAATRTFPAGTVVIDLAQPNGHLARAALEPDAGYEPGFAHEQDEIRQRNARVPAGGREEPYGFYDITAWSLPYTYGLNAWWSAEAPPSSGSSPSAEWAGTASHGGPAQHLMYVLDGESTASAIAGLRLASAGFRVEVADRPFAAGGRTWSAGSVVVRTAGNPRELIDALTAEEHRAGVTATGVDSAFGGTAEYDAGSSALHMAPYVRVAVIEDDAVDPGAYGEIWYLLAGHLGLPFTPLRISALSADELNRFNVLIVPDGNAGGAIGRDVRDRMRQWVEGGGVLLGIGGGGAWMADGDSAWIPTDAARTQAGGKPSYIPGAIVKAVVDHRDPLCFGYAADEVPVPVGGSSFIRVKPATAYSALTVASASRLAGFLWPGESETVLAGASILIDKPMGTGHAVYASQDLAFRDQWPGLRRLFVNAMLYLPSRRPVTDLTGAGQ